MKLRNKGITWKIFFYLLVFVLVVVIAITFAQGYALKRSYENDRINSIKRVASNVLLQSEEENFQQNGYLLQRKSRIMLIGV